MYASYRNKQSFQVHRAASIYRANAELYQRLFRGTQYLICDSNEYPESYVTALQNDIYNSIRELQSLKNSKCRQTQSVQKSNDKDSYLLSKLKHGWHHELWSELAMHSVYGPTIAILCLVGCRPSEFKEKGVFITYSHDGDLILKINGTKVRSNAGQPWRIAKIHPEATLCSKYLHALLTKSGRRGIYVNLQCSELLSRHIAQIGHRLWPDLSENVSATTFRKMVASEMKAVGWSKVRIAALLGHINTKTQRYYGKARYGGGLGFWVNDVVAPIVIKLSDGDVNVAVENAAIRLNLQLLS